VLTELYITYTTVILVLTYWNINIYNCYISAYRFVHNVYSCYISAYRFV